MSIFERLRRLLGLWLRCAWCDSFTRGACIYCGRGTCDICRYPVIAECYCWDCYEKEVLCA